MKVFDAGNDWATVYGEKTDDMLSRFHLIPERHGQKHRQTDGRTDRQTDRFPISLSRVSMLTCDKNDFIKAVHQT